MSTPTVLILIGHYLPGIKVGGPATSIRNIVEQLGHRYSFKLITSNTDFGESHPYEGIPTNEWIRKDNLDLLYIDSRKSSFPQLTRAIRNTPFDVLYLNPLLDPQFSSSMVLAAKLGILPRKPMVVAPRGELFDEALAFKPLKKKLFLAFTRLSGLYRGVRFHATNVKEQECIMDRLRVRPEQVKLARIISRYELASEESPDYRPEKNKLKIVFMARVSKDKNLPFAFDVLSQISSQFDVEFDVCGPIEDEPIWEECKKRISQLPSHVRVRYLGTIPKEQVRGKLGIYDLFFMPTFAENYGHAIAESLSVGAPVLISDNTPWRSLERQDLDGICRFNRLRNMWK